MDSALSITHYRSRITHHPLRVTDYILPIADRDTRESPVKEMVKELKEFGVDVYGYDPLLSKEEIEGFDVNALNNLDVKIKMDGVIVAVAHDEFKNKPVLKKKAFTERTTLLEENFLSTGSFFRKINKCIEVRGMFSEEEAKKKDFYYRRV